MTLKAFHIFFIVLSTLLSFGFGVWALQDHAASQNVLHLTLGIISFVVGCLLMVYLRAFFKKVRHLTSE
jgi:uncharacterized membrane protein HdeD (DUF308 family)